MQIIKKIVVKNLLFTLLIALVSFVFFSTFLTKYYLPVFWSLLIGLALVTLIIHITILKFSQAENTSKFFSRFFLVTGVKMIVLLVFIISYAMLNPKQAVSFLISFFVLYLLYSVFEVVVLIRAIKKPSKQ